MGRGFGAGMLVWPTSNQGHFQGGCIQGVKQCTAVKTEEDLALQFLYIPQQNSDVCSQADRAADRLVISPSYLGRVEESAPFCCTTVGEKGRKNKRTEAESISQEIVIPYVIDFHGISALYCTYDTASTSPCTHEDT